MSSIDGRCEACGAMISGGWEVDAKGKPLTSRHGGRAVYHAACTPAAMEQMRVFKEELGKELGGAKSVLLAVQEKDRATFEDAGFDTKHLEPGSPVRPIEGTITPTEILADLQRPVSEGKVSDYLRAAARYSLPNSRTGYEGTRPMENAERGFTGVVEGSDGSRRHYEGGICVKVEGGAKT